MLLRLARFIVVCLGPLFLGPLFLALAPLAHAAGGSGTEAPTLSFTSDLPGKARYLKLDLALETAKPEVGDDVKKAMPRIKHAITLLLSEVPEGELRTLAGKEALARDIRQAINKVIRANDRTGVKDVLFTRFLIQ